MPRQIKFVQQTQIVCGSNEGRIIVYDRDSGNKVQTLCVPDCGLMRTIEVSLRCNIRHA